MSYTPEWERQTDDELFAPLSAKKTSMRNRYTSGNSEPLDEWEARKRITHSVAESLRKQAEKVNGKVEKHARIGAIVLSTDPWSIQNEVLTPTLKIRRERVEARFGELAQRLAREAAEQGRILVEWT